MNKNRLTRNLTVVNRNVLEKGYKMLYFYRKIIFPVNPDLNNPD